MPGVGYLRKMINGVRTVTAPAEIDVTTAKQLRMVLLRAAGLAVLIRAHEQAVAEGGELHLVVPLDGAVTRMSGLTGLDLVVPCFSSLAQALAPVPGPQHCKETWRAAMPGARW